MESEKQGKPMTTAVAKPADVVASVVKILHGYTEKGELILPLDYSIDNALKAAWLALSETVDKDKRPALDVCSRASIANSLIDMAVQGLNPSKKQCYFIVYGKKLICLRSYFGTMAVAQRVAKTSDIWAEVVYEDDVFEYEIVHNRKKVTKHTQKLQNVKPGKIVAAYCVVEFGNERPALTEIMTIDQIRKAWAKSKMNPETPGSTHAQFPEEMCKRTVINRTCKPLINASSDSNLLLERFNRSSDELAEEEIAGDIEENANQELLDIETGVITEVDETINAAQLAALVAKHETKIPKPEDQQKLEPEF